MQQGIGLDSATSRKREIIIGAAIAILLISLGILKAFMEPSRPVQASPTLRESVTTGPEHASAITRARERLAVEKKEKALAAISEHQVLINANWQAKDTPDRLMAVGNLYQFQVGDYYSAIQSYRSVVDNFPKNTKAPQAYVELADCYERLGRPDQAKFIYQEMVEKLDPTTEHAKFAKLKLEEK